MQIITLITDFGYTDPFVGIIKGVILSICPSAKIVDILHNVSPQNLIEANWVIQSSYSYFPKGTIHLCVVDPGVGSLRKPILIETKNYFFIGPDNGIFTTVLEKEKIITVIELTKKRYWLKNISQTFHARDIFSPVSAHLAHQRSRDTIKTFGREMDKNDLVKLLVPKVIKKEKGYQGIIQYIDHFGNLITNIPNNVVSQNTAGKIKNINLKGLATSFAEVSKCNLSAIRGSSGYVELFVYKESASKLKDIKIGDSVEIWFP